MAKPKTNTDDLTVLFNEVLPYLIIDVDDIRGDMVRHSANYAYLAQKLAHAKGKVADIKVNLDHCKAVMFLTAKQHKDDFGKPITEQSAKSYVDIDDNVVAEKKRLAEAEEELAFWQTIIDAMYQRSYMLTKLAEMQQHELLLAGSEYNESIKQQLRQEISDDEYIQATAEVKRATRKSQVESMKESMNKKKGEY